MHEELYIYDNDGVRQQLELNTPSGITLKWVSNLFNSLDKVNSSYSYTFNIPMTRHNRAVLDNAEDIRHVSSYTGKKVKALFVQDGIPLFDNANLYLSKVSDGQYKCVFTWGVVEGLQVLNDEDCSLNELREKMQEAGVDVSSDSIPWNPGASEENYYNTQSVAHPYYNAGVPYIQGLEYDSEKVGAYDWTRFQYFKPKPVMPVPYIINCINATFGTKFRIYDTQGGESDIFHNVYEDSSKLYDGLNLVSMGCLPLVGNDLTDEQLEGYGMQGIFSAGVVVSTSARLKAFGKENILFFGGDVVNNYAKGADNYLCTAYLKNTESFDLPNNSIDGYAATTPTTGMRLAGLWSPYEIELQGKFKVRTSTQITSDDSSLLKIEAFCVYTHKYHIKFLGLDVTVDSVKTDDAGTLSPISAVNVLDGNKVFQYAEYEFNCKEDEGYSAWTVGEEMNPNIEGRYYFFHASQEILSFEGLYDERLFTCRPLINDAKKRTHRLDTFTNLPDIGCLAFMKSLFYMMGAFPYVDSKGYIRAKKYIELKENKVKGYVYNWTSKQIASTDYYESAEYKCGDFKRNNYYLNKWDDRDRTAAELLEEDDVYEDGIGNIQVGNATLDKEQTVHQTPFYSPYILNRRWPDMDTGGTIKAWEASIEDYEDTQAKVFSKDYVYEEDLETSDPIFDAVQMTEAKPAYGYLCAQNSATYPHLLIMKVLNPFKDMASNPSYQYLQEMVKTPFVIEENLRLNEFDLKDIDYTRPVYLGKYNAYFAIITIQRNSKGICKCELLKLPTE